VAFAGVERKVEMSGEAYFEVTHNAAMPFVVAKNEMQVQVLGTHFNVNAYDDEDDIKVTLLEGSVQVQDPRATKIIKPGEQARVNNGIQVMRGVDLAGVMAWKNGFFQFNGMGIQGVMRQLERWYDVEARYEGRIPERQFAGQIDRHANLSEVLTILKESKVNVKLEGKTLIVRP
jgi:ferric-dicitrate binding protein FerR (iron transport regulator)